MKNESESHSVVSDSLQPQGLHSPWNSTGQNTGVDDLSLLQSIFPIQGANPGLPHCRQILYQLSNQGSPRILEWVANPFPSGSSQPRDQTQVSHIADRFVTNWATKEAPFSTRWQTKNREERAQVDNQPKALRTTCIQNNTQIKEHYFSNISISCIWGPWSLRQGSTQKWGEWSGCLNYSWEHQNLPL